MNKSDKEVEKIEVLLNQNRLERLYMKRKGRRRNKAAVLRQKTRVKKTKASTVRYLRWNLEWLFSPGFRV